MSSPLRTRTPLHLASPRLTSVSGIRCSMSDAHYQPRPSSSGLRFHTSSFSKSAFTLIELLVVVATVMIILSLIGVLWRNLEERNLKARAQTELARLQAALQDYRGEQGTYPSTLGEISNRLPRTFTSFDASGVPLDPWSNPYWFDRNANGLTYTLFSCGPDCSNTVTEDNISPGRF